MRLLAILVAVAFAVAVIGAVDADSSQAASCEKVGSGHKVAYRVHAHNVKCMTARDRLRRWMRTGFPHTEFRWSCDLHGRQKTCSKGLGPDPRSITFYVRRRAEVYGPPGVSPAPTPAPTPAPA